MTIGYLKKACASAFFLVIALVSNHAVANQGQTFSGEPELVPNAVIMSHDIFMFSKLGDFIDPNNLELTVLSIEAGRRLANSHGPYIKSTFLANAPKDLHKAYRQIDVDTSRLYTSPNEVSGPTIITIAFTLPYRHSALIRKHPDTIILYSAGNESEPEPAQVIAAKYNNKHHGINVFYAGGTHPFSEELDPESGKPGKYGNAYIADRFRMRGLRGERQSGTSSTVQIVGAKLAVLYKALNVNGTWSLRDAMQLFMTTRKNVEKELYRSDLTKLLVRDDNGEVYLDSDGKTRLLPEAKLREMLSTSPLYRNQ